MSGLNAYKSKYEEISAILYQEIRQGDFMPGSRFYSESILAKRFNVTHITIRNAMRQLQDLGLIERIHGKGTFIRNSGALRGSIGLLVWNGEETLAHPAFSEVVRGVSNCLAQHDYSCTIIYINAEMQDRGQVAEKINSSRVDGVIVSIGQIRQLDLAAIDSNCHIVLIENQMPDITPYSVCCNTEHAYFMLTKHVIETGHKRIGMIHPGKNKFRYGQILSGYHNALEKAGLRIDPEIIRKVETHTEKAGHDETRALIDNSVSLDAILAGDDYMAMGALRALGEGGIHVPGEVAVAGYNDMPIAEVSDPPLTTVRIPYEQLGYNSAQMLVELLTGKAPQQKILNLETELVVRKSTEPICGLVNMAD